MESFYSSAPSNKELDHDSQSEDLIVDLSLSISPISSSPLNPPLIQDIASPLFSKLQSSTPLLTPPIRPNGDAKSLCTHVRRRPPSLGPGKSETIPAPYPWATTRRATLYTLIYLLSKGIDTINGEVQCKRCEQQYEISYDLQRKFMEVAAYISKNKGAMHDRAPAAWMNPCLPDCKFCEQRNSVKPMLDKKRSINWLFLLLGQMLGCCKLSQLKYFCKHTNNHRTGAKDRVLYLTYLGLCKQLDPDGPFDR